MQEFKTPHTDGFRCGVEQSVEQSAKKQFDAYFLGIVKPLVAVTFKSRSTSRAA
jgi:hypothetical protein